MVSVGRVLAALARPMKWVKSLQGAGTCMRWLSASQVNPLLMACVR
jgi:hypothetical protein